MYLQYLDNKQLEKFLNSIDSRIVSPTIRPADVERESVIVFSPQINATFHITDFECIDIKTGRIYSKQFRKFMISVLDNINIDIRKLGDEYINDLHAHLEQDTICGAII